MRTGSSSWRWQLSRAMRLALRWFRRCRLQRGGRGVGVGGATERSGGARLLELWRYGRLLLSSLHFNSLTDSDTLLDCAFEPVYWIVDNVTRWFGVVFVGLVVLLTTSVVVIIYLFLLPTILSTYPSYWIAWHLSCGHWLLAMVVFHYYKATTTPPGHPPKRYFFSFCLYMTLGCFYCSVSSKALFLEAYGAIEVRRAPNGCLYILISRAETSVERHINHKETKRLREKGKVFKNPYHHGTMNNWKLLLGVEERRHWVTRVLLPSSHLPREDGIMWDFSFARTDPMAI
ncbi:putative palmitoyltransferase ZDHHC16 [Liparis tanakae]|uniref:Putative palmitoyltransferase ZDHHC16 n=1 Tax=Liparis tanakae TaxID=230148 RepID=A0A4Z2F779_9TELE|nr:putative palmitoyltransferase ZDHHC16 [Liparis tanakae]